MAKTRHIKNFGCPCHWSSRLMDLHFVSTMKMEARLDPPWAYVMGKMLELMED